MRWFFIIFLILALAILFGLHYLIYLSLLKFFQITSHNARVVWFIILILLAISFIIASWLTNISSNLFNQIFYFLSASWFGLTANLLLIALFGWIIILVAKIFQINFNLKIIGWTWLIISIGLFIFGYLNAQQPRLKFLTVKINNLPADWQGKTVVQISDVHAGVIINEKFLNKLMTKLSQIRKDAVFITGDYFDGEHDDVGKLAEPLSRLKAEKGVYFITGNHETYVGLDKVLPALADNGVKILRDEKITIDGLSILGVDYPTMMEKKDFAAVFKKIIPGEPTILLYHEPRPKLVAQAKAAGANLMLSGHLHAGQVFPVSLIDQIFYGKYYYGLYQDGNFSLYTTSGVGTWGPPIRTGNIPEIVVITLE